MTDEKKSNRNRNQHYVPENYFIEFSKDGSSICSLFKKDGVAKPEIPFGSQSSGHWFYGDAEREDEITKFDTKYCENRRTILESLVSGATILSSLQIETLLENTLFQRERTLSSRRAEQGVLDFHDEFFTKSLDLDNYDSGRSPEATEAVNEVMRLAFKSFCDPKVSQSAKLMMTDTYEVSDLKLIILRNHTAHSFIFSDSPVAYTNPALRNIKCSRLANINVGLQIFYPLNPEFLALFYDPAVYKIGETDSSVLDVTSDSDIRQINKLQLHEAANSIYFSRPEDCGYVETLWREEEINFDNREKNVESVPELSLDGYITGRQTFSIYESEPSFSPCLEFITSDLSNSNLPFRAAYWRRYISDCDEVPRYNDLIDRHPDSQNKV